ncbi:MAG: nitrate/nitrite transporter NrtS [Acidobacteriota bacterium]
MTHWIRLALQPAVVRRGIMYGIFVGLILNAINHGGALLAGDLDTSRALRMTLTFFVPYLVSTASSVAALRQQEQGDSS